MLPASLGILAALALVLGLMALGVWALKRMGAATAGGKSRLPVEIVHRLPLGPKSGLAVVRVGEKVLAVSVGEGGVHTLFEVDEADRQRIVALSELALPQTSSEVAQSRVARSVQGVLTGPLLRAFGGGRTSASSDAAVESFARTMTRALDAESAPAAESVPVVPQHAPEKSTAPGLGRDLHSVLSMTFAPSTRLLSFVAAFALAALAAAPLRADAQAVPDSARPVAGATPVVPVTPVAPTPAPATVQTVPTTATGATPTTPTAAPRTPTTAAANQPAQARVNPAQPAGATTQAQPADVEPASAADAIAGLVPQLDLRMGNGPDGGLRLNGTVGVVLMMGLLSMVPTLILMMTGFTRILIVLHFLKQAMGTQSAPPAHLVGALALLLTGFVMAPTLTEANRTAITPWLEGRMEQTEMLKVGVLPFRAFMLRQTNEKDLRTFVDMSQIAKPDTPDDVPLHVLMSAFVASELRTAFQIGFAIYLPFIIIDAVVASVLMAMGMFMLPPAMISLPFKLLLFVLVDGWSLTIQSLVQSFR